MGGPRFHYEDAPQVAEEFADGAEAWERAKKRSKTVISEHNDDTVRVHFDGGPVCIMHTGDWHIPSTGTDYEQLEKDLDFLNQPGVFASFMGDLVDNFIIGKLMAMQMFNEFTVNDQWAMLRHALGRVPKEKALWFVNGNHDDWTRAVSGIDYFGDVASQMVPKKAYARNELWANVTVGKSRPFVFRMRHKWRGYSQFNATHGIEQSLRLDGRVFDIGVGAHTHVSSLVREFNFKGETKLAVQCGAYKVVDDYASMLGVPTANGRAAAYTILEEDGSMWGTSSRTAAANYMRAVHGDKVEGRVYNG